MTPEEILACTLWAEDRSGGVEGMEPIAGVIMNRVEQPGWWGRDVVGICLCSGQFDGWNWKDPNFRKCLTIDDTDPQYALALMIARTALRGDPLNRAGGATHYYAKTMYRPPAWAYGDPLLHTKPLTPVFESAHHLFFKIGLSG